MEKLLQEIIEKIRPNEKIPLKNGNFYTYLKKNYYNY